MRYLIAILFPFLAFLTIGKVLQGILCLILQITMIGWPVAAIWALISVSSYNSDKRADRLEKAIVGKRRAA